jgi:hypothetical protein
MELWHKRLSKRKLPSWSSSLSLKLAREYQVNSNLDFVEDSYVARETISKLDGGIELHGNSLIYRSIIFPDAVTVDVRARICVRVFVSRLPLSIRQSETRTYSIDGVSGRRVR